MDLKQELVNATGCRPEKDGKKCECELVFEVGENNFIPYKAMKLSCKKKVLEQYFNSWGDGLSW